MPHSVAKTAPKKTRIAVVGRNIAAGLCAVELAGLPDTQVTWYQTQKDRLEQSDPHWLVLPHWYLSQVLSPKNIPVVDPIVFYRPASRMRASTFISAECAEFPSYTLPVRRRCLAVGLWNDLSPPLWNAYSGGVFEPNVYWPQKTSISMQLLESGLEYLKLGLFPRDQALKALEESVLNRGGDIKQGFQTVVGIHANRFGTHQVAHNPPYGYSSAERVLWTTVSGGGGGLNEEGDPAKQLLKAFKTPTSAAWRSYGTWVPLAAVTPLPLFSLWLNDERRESLLQTGSLESRSLKQVLAIPNADGMVWLQIQVLALRDSDRVVEARPDTFLWELCPFLEKIEARYKELFAEEQHFFSDPLPRRHVYGHGIEFWFPGSMGQPAQAVKKFYQTKKNRWKGFDRYFKRL